MEHYQPVGARPALIRKDYGLILEASGGLALMPLARLIHERVTTTLAEGREDVDWGRLRSRGIGKRGAVTGSNSRSRCRCPFRRPRRG